MARNKYPEETVHKILNIAYRLFTEKGYDQTSIQDIVDELGMSKGAIYHHFKSKEDILIRLYQQMDDTEAYSYYQDIICESNLNGLQKLQRLLLHEMTDETKLTSDTMRLPFSQNPQMLAVLYRSTLENAAPVLEELIRQGNKDGSLHVQHPSALAQTIGILINLWVNPAAIPATRAEFEEKVLFCAELFASMGLPLLDEAGIASSLYYYDKIFGSASPA